MDYLTIAEQYVEGKGDTADFNQYYQLFRSNGQTVNGATWNSLRALYSLEVADQLLEQVYLQ